MKICYHVILRLSTLILLLLTSCAYRMGAPERALPSGYKQMTIPIFKNLSMEPAIEVTFTNALIKEFERSRVAHIVETSQAEVVIEGVIQTVTYTAGGPIQLASGSSLASTYDISVVALVTVKRQADQTVLWTGQFSRTRTYNAPQVQLPTLNTVNPLYNLSARRQNFDILAADMMAEAHDRLTENF